MQSVSRPVEQTLLGIQKGRRHFLDKFGTFLEVFQQVLNDLFESCWDLLVSVSGHFWSFEKVTKNQAQKVAKRFGNNLKNINFTDT